MNKIKNLIIVFFGITALVGLIGAVVPTTTQGQGGGNSKDVNVVNTPTVLAQQSGAWNVGITGTPTVNLANNSVQVNNPATNPVLVRDVDISARQPVQVEGFVSVGIGQSSNGKVIYTVPVGKRLVVEFVSAEGDVRNTQSPRFQILTAFDDEFVIHTLTSTLQGQGSPTSTHHNVSQLVRFYAQPLSNVIFNFGRSFMVDGDARAAVTLSGYLEDAP